MNSMSFLTRGHRTRMQKCWAIFTFRLDTKMIVDFTFMLGGIQIRGTNMEITATNDIVEMSWYERYGLVSKHIGIW